MAEVIDFNAFKPFVQIVGRGEKLKRDLTYEESLQAMRLILTGAASEAQIGAFLIAQRVKGEAADEIRGFTDVVRAEFMHSIAPKVENLLDLGVPYDGKSKTAQLAPAIAILLATAGVPVILHGDEGVPTKEGVGPGTVLAELGVATMLPPQSVERRIEQVGVGYLSAAQFVPAWHALLPIRRQFGLRTVLNSVEKLFNPANAPYQISGFFHGNYVERIRQTQTGSKVSWMVQGEEGSVEMAAGRKTHIFAQTSEADIILEPAAVGLPERQKIEVAPDVVQHAALNQAILAGQPSPASDQAIFTAATILSLVGATESIASGMERVRQLIDSGAAQRKLELMREMK